MNKHVEGTRIGEYRTISAYCKSLRAMYGEPLENEAHGLAKVAYEVVRENPGMTNAKVREQIRARTGIKSTEILMWIIMWAESRGWIDNGKESLLRSAKYFPKPEGEKAGELLGRSFEERGYTTEDGLPCTEPIWIYEVNTVGVRCPYCGDEHGFYTSDPANRLGKVTPPARCWANGRGMVITEPSLKILP